MKLRHSISHSLESGAAQKLLQRAFDHYSTRYPLYRGKLNWTPDGKCAEAYLHARGFDLQVELEIRPREVFVEMDVPLLLMPLQGAVRRAIDREAARWMGGEFDLLT